MNRFAAAPLALILLALGLAACGGDDAPSKADFAADAEEVCKNAEEKLEGVGENASNPEEIADAVDKVIDATQNSVDELQDLELPEGADGKAAEQFVNALGTDIEDKGIPALEALRDALEKNDQQAAQKAAQQLQAIETTDTDDLARKLGAEACAE